MVPNLNNATFFKTCITTFKNLAIIIENYSNRYYNENYYFLYSVKATDCPQMHRNGITKTEVIAI